jgi:hypothetical protein
MSWAVRWSMSVSQSTGVGVDSSAVEEVGQLGAAVGAGLGEVVVAEAEQDRGQLAGVVVARSVSIIV